MKKILLERRGLEMAYDDIGDGDPLLLLHGFPFDREMWTPQFKGLADSYRLLAPDYPGFGASGSATEALTVDSLADLMADFLDAIGVMGTVVVIGLSMGGYVALAMARQQRQRLRGLVLADTKAEPDDDAAKAGRDAMCVVAREDGATGVFEKLLPKILSDATRTKNPTVVDEVRRIATRQSSTAIVSALMALRDRPDATAGLEQIAVPTLILVGEHDKITPPSVAESMSKRILGSQLAIIPGAGHLSNLEAPEVFNTEIRNFIHKRQ